MNSFDLEKIRKLIQSAYMLLDRDFYKLVLSVGPHG